MDLDRTAILDLEFCFDEGVGSQAVVCMIPAMDVATLSFKKISVTANKRDRQGGEPERHEK